MNSKFSWPSTSKAYQLEFPIGYGAFGTVYLAFVLQGPQMNSKVAIKVIDLDQFPDESIEEIRKEIKITRLCSHPNVVHYHIAFLSHKQI